MNYSDLAKKIVSLVGGEENIKNFSHCMTRIRIVLQDKDKVQISNLKETEKIMGVQFATGQLQIVVGEEVSEVFKEIEKIVENEIIDDSEQVKEEGFKIEEVFDFFSNVFMPIVPVIAATGILQGILMVITNYNLAAGNSGTVQVLEVISDCAFYFLPFMIAYTVAKTIKTNVPLALALAGALMYPTIAEGAAEGGTITFLGLPVPLLEYSSSVFPIIISVFVLKYVYNFIDQFIPKALKVIFTPLLVLLIVIPIMLIAIAPLGNYLGNLLATFIQSLFGFSPIIAGVIFTAIFPLVVVAGMHHALMPVFMQNIGSRGYDYMLPLVLVAVMAQAGGAFGVYLKSKDKKEKAIALSATITGIVGITEPALYGCLLKYKKALLAVLAAGGIGGGFAAAFEVKSYAFALPSVISLPTYFGPALPYLIAGFTMSFIIAVAIINIVGIEEKEADNLEINENSNNSLENK